MPIETRRDDDSDLTIQVVTGTVLKEEMFGVVKDFYAGRPTRLVLWDLSRADFSDLTQLEVRGFASLVAELSAKRVEGRTAVVAPEDLQFGLGRMVQFYIEKREVPFSLQIFRSLPEAVHWLGTADDS
ncbi:MAG TPA: hypothetical protein VLA34_00525 [Candidatus Krumholzibacterium sp.]|nr:hypothetical protein [Candidatus Krumholzibacterium sp.]